VNKTPFLLLIALLSASTATLALEITSVAPTRATPATRVILTGGPFTLESRIFLGEQFVAATRVLSAQLEFTVPPMPPGSYSLTVQDDIDTAIQPFTFEVLAPQPHVAAVVPDNLDFCADQAERLVLVEGSNFVPDSIVQLNGNAISSRVVNAGSLEFRLPEMPAGVYGVVVRNPDGATSLPHSLWINSVPEIDSVERGDDAVNHYEVIIRGKNFFYNSILVVKEPENTSVGKSVRQLAFHAAQSTAGSGQSLLPASGEKLLYGDCRTLLYQRYPTSLQDKELTLQVINPDGKKTEPYLVTLP